MPELPEVDVVTRSLKKTIKNLKIIKIVVNNRNLRFKIPKNFKNILKNKIIKNIKRKSKYIVLDLGKLLFRKFQLKYLLMSREDMIFFLYHILIL